MPATTRLITRRRANNANVFKVMYRFEYFSFNVVYADDNPKGKGKTWNYLRQIKLYIDSLLFYLFCTYI